jgi:uncharacterized membrane protein
MTTRPASRKWALRANLILLSISRRWLGIAITLLAIYVSLPFVAPTLMRLGLRGPGEVIYFMYSPFCHQFAFRTIFLYGEEPMYPRAITGVDTPSFEDTAINSQAFREAFSYESGIPPESITRDDLSTFSPALQFAARSFRGDEQMGYKLTLCARDISIYIAMLIGAILYRMVRRRLRPVPMLIYVILGLGPIGIDGFSQLLGYPPFNFWPPRETEPIFRIITGALFGLMNVWLGFPYLEMSFRETRMELEAKFRRAGIAV